MSAVFDDEEAFYDDALAAERELECQTCGGSGRVATLDYESYLGDSYKPCPTCDGCLRIGEPPLS